MGELGGRVVDAEVVGFGEGAPGGDRESVLLTNELVSRRSIIRQAVREGGD